MPTGPLTKKLLSIYDPRCLNPVCDTRVTVLDCTVLNPAADPARCWLLWGSTQFAAVVWRPRRNKSVMCRLPGISPGFPAFPLSQGNSPGYTARQDPEGSAFSAMRVFKGSGGFTRVGGTGPARVVSASGTEAACVRNELSQVTPLRIAFYIKMCV